MTLKAKILEHIQKHGPQTNAELVAKFKVLKASVRRACGELVHEGTLAPMPSEGARRFGLSADARAAEPAKATAAPKKSRPKMPAPTAAKKADESKPADPQDWRMTDFTF
jgi:DNA-binding IclR family transcriptional regulator